MKRYKAFLFDFDGVLARTMEDNYLAWANTFAQFGMALTRDDYFPLEGRNPKNVARILLKHFGKSEDLADSLSRLKDTYYLAHHSFQLYSGAESLLRELKETASLALVTGAGRQRLEGSVPDNFLAQFDAIVTGEADREDKPSPQPYLEAAKKLGLEPSSCLVIENAPLGVESAKKAGMDCVAITSTLGREHLKQADFIVEKITELRTLLLSS